jgi:hypothetical protein
VHPNFGFFSGGMRQTPQGWFGSTGLPSRI